MHIKKYLQPQKTDYIYIVYTCSYTCSYDRGFRY